MFCAFASVSPCLTKVTCSSSSAISLKPPVCGLEGLGVVFLRISEMEAESQFSNSESRKKRKKECQVFLAEEVMHEDQEGVGGIREGEEGTVAEATATALAEEVGVETTMEVVVRIAVVVVAVVVAREETQTKQMRV
jgi:hypothetical protein